MCVFFLPPPTAVVIPTTSVPHTTLYKVADVPKQLSSPKTNTYQTSRSSSAIQTDARVSKLVPEVDPSHLPGKSQNQVPSKEDTNKNIPASPLALSQVGSLTQTQGVRSSPSETNPVSLKNISEVTPAQVQSELLTISNTIAKTVVQSSERTAPTLGKSLSMIVFGQ